MNGIETKIDLIRHGEPVGGQRMRGSQDDPLSELGWYQMRDSVGEHSPWDSIVSSPLKRCFNFSEELPKKLSVDLEVDGEFREIGFGEWEGKRIIDLMKEDPEAIRKYWKDPESNGPEGSELMSVFINRVHEAWDKLVADTQGKHTLLVCHGGVIRAILTRVLGMGPENLWNFDVPYANVSRVVYHHFPDDGHTAQLKFHKARF